MAESKSHNLTEAFHCTLLIFSGKNNPEWDIQSDESRYFILQYLLQTPLATSETLPNSLLGYNGLLLQGKGSFWRIFRGFIWEQESTGESLRCLKDEDRSLEKYLLKTLPEPFEQLLTLIKPDDWE